MEIVRRVLKGHPGLYQVAIGRFGSIALGAVFWLVMARLLEPGVYGNVKWLMSIAMFASILCVLGWGKTLITYYPKKEKEELIGGATMIVLVASLAVGFAMSALIEPVVGILIVGLSLFTMTISSELGKHRYGRYKWISVGTKLAILPLAVGMYFLMGLVGIIVGYAIPMLFVGLLSVGHIRKGNPGIREAKGKIGFAIRAFGVDASRGSTGLLDKILIGPLFGMRLLGLYQLAYQIFATLGVLPGVLFSYMLPQKSAGEETGEVGLLGILASIAMAISVIILSPWLIPRIFPSFAESVTMIQIMSLGVVPYTVAMIQMSGLYAQEKPGTVLVSYLSALTVGIIGILSLGKYFGGIGLAVSMVLLQTTLAIMLLFHTRR